MSKDKQPKGSIHWQFCQYCLAAYDCYLSKANA